MRAERDRRRRQHQHMRRIGATGRPKRMTTTMLRRPVPALISILFLASGCTTTIHGVIRDKPTGNPLSSVSVAIGEESATTNALGSYLLKAHVKPSSALLVNAPGYFMYSASVAKRKDEGGEISRDVELVPRSGMAPRQ